MSVCMTTPQKKQRADLQDNMAGTPVKLEQTPHLLQGSHLEPECIIKSEPRHPSGEEPLCSKHLQVSPFRMLTGNFCRQELKIISRTVHFQEFEEFWKEKRLIPNEPCTFDNTVMNGILFKFIKGKQDSWGNVRCKVDFNTFEQQFLQSGKYGVKSCLAERSSIKDLPLLLVAPKNICHCDYNPRKVGEVWSKDINGKNTFIVENKDTQDKADEEGFHLGMHVVLEDDDYNTLFHMCKFDILNHEQTKSTKTFKCKMQMSNLVCPSPWSRERCQSRYFQLVLKDLLDTLKGKHGINEFSDLISGIKKNDMKLKAAEEIMKLIESMKTENKDMIDMKIKQQKMVEQSMTDVKNSIKLLQNEVEDHMKKAVQEKKAAMQVVAKLDKRMDMMTNISKGLSQFS